MNKAIEIKNLNCAYGKHPVLDEISFSVLKGDFFIVIGPNGSGKTTLMKNISGIIKPQNGHLDVFESDVRGYSGRSLAQIIALVPQEVPANFPFTVTEFVLMGRSPYQGMLGIPREKDIEIADRAISFTDVGHLKNR
ncbi:MAG: ABC transporter ATP-binding protein, partial [Deltaproteobacteria bacterium]|nr:ABC transporter ATP-binding protein [Deltaproteobacteria bacterium]